MFASSLHTPDHVVQAERLGYRRAWCSDNPAVHSDMWMALALAAQRTTRIGLGTAVMVPSLRHPVVSAAATATLAGLASDRVAVAIGTGFTSRLSVGQPPVPWVDVTAYVRTFRALLAGEDALWEGQAVRMMHARDQTPGIDCYRAQRRSSPTTPSSELSATGQSCWPPLGTVVAATGKC